MGALPDSPRGCIRNPNNTDKVYFFSGDRYWRYDLGKDYGEAGYPLSMDLWHVTGGFAAGVDAALDGQAAFTGKSYFFKNDQYVRYDWRTDTIDRGPNSIAKGWGLPEPFASGVDVAFNGLGAFKNKAYFFKDDIYARVDWTSLGVDQEIKPISAWSLGDGFTSGLTACCDAPKVVGHDKAYFFKGDQYVRYDWTNDRADEGYPLPTSAGWPTGLAVWAEHKRAPLLVCSDARLEAGANRVIAYPGGTSRGQAGWQLGMKFSTLQGLADALERAVIPDFYGDDGAGSATIGAGSITRLAINAHGLPGQLDVSNEVFDGKQLSSFTLLELTPQLVRIARMLEPGAPIILLGCNAGRGDSGDNLIEPLSAIWAGHPVTAFTTIGYSESGKQRRPEACDNPGMRVTDETDVFSSDPFKEQQLEDEHFSPIWENLNALPWGHDNLQRHRKTALNGQLVFFDADD
ncbi:hemopexin repeat-containing protein [Kribbella sp. NPDC026611]|uniref:hemopexin repeat-containing protein n=1 Tax=Kribbella sp. NPDC026611 TaxID=3154911 RepID=UPI0033FBA9E6